MTCVTPRAASVSPGVPPMKSGMAIGTGWTLPCVTSSRSCADALVASNALAEVAAPSASTRRRVKPNGDRSFVMASFVPNSVAASAAEHVTWIEGDFDVFPDVVFCNRHEAVGRAAPHRAQRTLGCDLEGRMRAGVRQRRIGRERAVLIEADAHHHDQVARVSKSGRRIPALLDARA